MDALHEIARLAVSGAFGVLACCVLPSSGHAQPSGCVSGRVVDMDRRPIARVTVTVERAAITRATDASGRYSLPDVPRGPRVLQFHRLGYAVRSVAIVVAADSTDVGDVTLEVPSTTLSAVVVEAVSHETDRVIDAPAAVDVVRPQTVQMPRALARVPGLDLLQSSSGHFDVNARGLNTTAARKTVVMQDGRDLGLVVTGQQVWDAMPGPAEDVERVEVIRGPSSAMYGANAFNGVISVTTPPARDVIGTKVTLGGGELRTGRVDLRNAGEWSSGTLAYRLSGGYGSNSDWTRSRTAKNLADWKEEYATAGSVVPLAATPESLPLAGQSRDPVTGRAIGTPDPITRLYGSARLDYYGDERSSVTVEGGATRLTNEINLSGSDRDQISRVVRPWGRLAWTTDGRELSASYSGASISGVALGSAQPLLTNESAVHVEGRLHREFGGEAGRVVTGISLQNNFLDTHGLVLDPAKDARADQYYGAFGEAEHTFRRWHLLGALRWDASDLSPMQISPKVAAVFTPAENHALHFTFDRAFLTPGPANFFANRKHRPIDLSQIETQLRVGPLGPALAGVPAGALFGTSARVPAFTVGNPRLVPQTATNAEVGYKGELASGAFLTLDVYYARIQRFTTPQAGATAVNPDFKPWTSPNEIPAAEQPLVESAVRKAVDSAGYANALTRLKEDGTTAVVLSYGNAGVADEAGVELGASAPITKALKLTASYTSSDFTIRSNLLNGVPSPNTPPNKGDIGLDYVGRHGLDIALDARIVEAYQWASGTFVGRIPASQFVQVRARYLASPRFGLYVDGSDVLDQRRFQVFGGAVIGRRVVAGITSEF
jgi:outer membrane receptor protein involved in Fe transport